MAKLDRVELLAVHLGNHHLSRKLHDLGLVGVVLESTDGGNRLVHRGTRAMSRLEGLTLAGISGLILALALIAPVAFKASRPGASMAASAASAALEVIVRGKVECTTTNGRSTSAIDCHALATAVGATATASSEARHLKAGRRGAFILIVRFVGSGAGGKLESGSGSLLLSKLGGLFRIGQGKGVSSLVPTAGRSSTATTAGGVLTSVTWGLKVSKARARGSRRGCRGWSHAHVGHSRLITAMCQWLGRRAQGKVLLMPGLGELEGGLPHVAHGLQRIEGSIMCHGLAGGNHAHVDVLLVGSLDLLLLLLQQLDLLLDSQLFHCGEEDVSIRHGGMRLT